MTVIETPRLRLRPHRLEDFAELHAMWTDPAIYRFIGGREPTEEQSWARLLCYAGHWALVGYGLFAVEERATGRFVGETGPSDFRRGHGSRFDDAPEMGWVFASDVRGRGYALEAAAAALAWLEQERGIARTVCIIDPVNSASRVLAARLGYHPFGEALRGGVPVQLFERDGQP